MMIFVLVLCEDYRDISVATLADALWPSPCQGLTAPALRGRSLEAECHGFAEKIQACSDVRYKPHQPNFMMWVALKGLNLIVCVHIILMQFLQL